MLYQYSVPYFVDAKMAVMSDLSKQTTGVRSEITSMAQCRLVPSIL